MTASSLWIPLARRANIVGALTMREILTRYGRKNIGFLWLIGEPILFAMGIIGIRSLIYHEQGLGTHGLPLVTFLMTGYMPFIMFRHITSRSIHCIRANQPLLYHRQVKLLDVFVARYILEIAGVIAAFAFGSALFIAFGLMELPADLPLVYAGWFYAIWFSIGFALVVGPASELSEVVDRIYQPFSYFLVVLSGCFYMAAWLPPALREYALYNPMLHFFEMIRYGWFGDPVHAYYDVGYLTGWCLTLTFGGLIMISLTRTRMAIE